MPSNHLEGFAEAIVINDVHGLVFYSMVSIKEERDQKLIENLMNLEKCIESIGKKVTP
jgi:hypothetical protein